MFLSENIEKGMTLTAYRRIDKTPEKRFSDKFPTTGTDKMTNARQLRGGEGGRVWHGYAWN